MDKVLKEKITNNTFEGINKIIESQYKDHPNESSYSICRIQVGKEKLIILGMILIGILLLI